LVMSLQAANTFLAISCFWRWVNGVMVCSLMGP